MEGWAKIKTVAKYSGVSERTLREWLKDGLKHSRLPSGTILIRYDSIDAYLESFASTEDKVDKVVDEVMRDLR